jgi:DNA-directed RNA polymerase subunit N
MIIPVRCFTCGKVIGGLYEEYLRRTQMGEKPQEVMDSLGLERYCCRRMFLTHVELADELAPYG